ncbi:hypothetical protein [uncultured Chryseobacterium sp.]|uniref:hypothetical protein n=1 Tax=uncultured Chryseobacterium sp. TaxID=259322 RepID=UPI0026007110|nr:hypothetical protein [uncultured Chryseobacterium sp.]
MRLNTIAGDHKQGCFKPPKDYGGYKQGCFTPSEDCGSLPQLAGNKMQFSGDAISRQ